MIRMLRPAMMSTALLTAACYHGPDLRNYQPANSPKGIEAELRLEESRVRGELLEVQDTALVVFTDYGKVVLVRIDDISVGVFAQRGQLLSGAYDARALGELRLLSRFPAGMTPAIRARLLAAYGQTQVEVAR